MITQRADINHVLMQMREMKAQAGGQTELQAPVSAVDETMRANGLGATKAADAPDFSQMFSTAINKVNETQQTSSALAKAYEQGDPGVTLTQVMVASQKSSVAFTAVMEVRNKLVEAYKDVMNMPI